MSIFKDIDIVAFDIMGVILTNPSLIRKGLYPIYKDRYSYEYIKSLYKNVRSNVDGDMALWKGLGINDPDIARKEFLDTYEIDDGFEEFRSLLTKKNIRKGIISNMPEEWGDYIAQKFNLVKDFDPILLSSDIGVAKPDYGKYDEFLKRAEVRGDRVLFIDDKLKNLEMGKKLGFKTVLFDRGRKRGGFEPDVIITSFQELI
jgi:HAD superfamily hydrolase (TIGR01549 family)